MGRPKKAYESKATTTTIKISSRASVGIQKRSATNYFTVEYTEERTIPEDADIEKERQLLWETCNNEVDTQIIEIMEANKK